MSLTIAQYEQTLKTYTAFMAQHEDTLRSVMLYGSMARGEVVPGHSDLDFWVFAKAANFADEATFSKLLTTLTEAAQILADSGLPVIHAFCYYADDELDWMPRALVPNLGNPASARTIVGDDIVGDLTSTPASRDAYRYSYFGEMRRQMFQPLAAFLGRTEFHEKEAKAIFAALKYVKYIPEAACAALDRWPGEQASLAILRQEMPEIDFSVADELLDHRLSGELLNNGPLLGSFLERALEMVEAVHWQLVARGSDDNE